MAKFDIRNLYYITHIDNITSILKHGILADDEVESLGIDFTPIYDDEIVNKRKEKQTPQKESLWKYANLYFQPRNPMMYRVVHEKNKRDIAIIAIKSSVLSKPGIIVTDGNAANMSTNFFDFFLEGKTILQQNWQIIQNEWWKDSDGSKRKIMAECLIPTKVDPELISTIYVTDSKTKDKLQNLIGSSNIPIVPEPYLFFQTKNKNRIGNISLVDGDMFFSNMQTLTISVNLQGIMGKGLASRAKYQFPDVYVVYQDACKAKKLTATKPYLYKRESSLDQELSDDSTLPLNTPNSVKWFLLFATKRKWRENSRLEDIEGGLDWLIKNLKQQEITSLALPALGCGLGNLNWIDVGPLMFRYLYDIGIDVAIYLPREHQIESQYLEESYLLKH